jgi:hypothetical protein
MTLPTDPKGDDMSKLTKFCACFGWVMLASERITGEVPTQWPIWFWWGCAAVWLVTSLLPSRAP